MVVPALTFPRSVLLAPLHGRYNMNLGADVIGTRLNKIYKENLNEEEILNELDILFQRLCTKRKRKKRLAILIVRERSVFDCSMLEVGMFDVEYRLLFWQRITI